MSIVFDIETAPQDKEMLQKNMPEFNPADVKLGRTTDPEKVKATIEKARLKHEENYWRKSALSATTGRVLLVGFMYEDQSTMFIEGPEERILTDFWDVWQISSPTTLIGFNCKKFDIPFLIRRSWALGVKIPLDVLSGRYQSERIVDLLKLWDCGEHDSESGSAKLDMISKTLGGTGKNGNGADFHNIYIEDRKRALDYATNDLRQTQLVAIKMGIL